MGYCHKIGYDDRADAAKAMRATIRRCGNKKFKRADVYKCSGCGKWHWGRVGNKSRNWKKKKCSR